MVSPDGRPKRFEPAWVSFLPVATVPVGAAVGIYTSELWGVVAGVAVMLFWLEKRIETLGRLIAHLDETKADRPREDDD